MAAQPEDRIPDELGDGHRHDGAHDHADPGGEIEVLSQQRGRIRSRSEEDRVPEGDLAAIAREEIPGLGEHGEQEDRDDDVARMRLGEDEGKAQEKEEQGTGACPARHGPARHGRHQKRPRRPWGRQSTTTR